MQPECQARGRDRCQRPWDSGDRHRPGTNGREQCRQARQRCQRVVHLDGGQVQAAAISGDGGRPAGVFGSTASGMLGGAGAGSRNPLASGATGSAGIGVSAGDGAVAGGVVADTGMTGW